MNAKKMLDMSSKVVARQDIDRDLLLFFMNAARKAVIRDRAISKFDKYLTGVPHTTGVIDIDSLGIKSVKLVEYDKGAVKIPLTKFASYSDARKYYPDFSKTGAADHYLEIGSTLYVLPVPETGAINLIAEMWPADLTDSITSSDLLTNEIPEAWIYLAAAEYFDYFDEGEKGNYWRQKGSLLVEQYITQLNKQETYGTTDFVESYFS